MQVYLQIRGMSYASQYNNPLHRFIRLFEFALTIPGATYHSWLKDVVKVLEIEKPDKTPLEASHEALGIILTLWKEAVVWIRTDESLDEFQKDRILPQLVSLRPLICTDNMGSVIGRDFLDLVRQLQLTATFLPNEPRLDVEDLDSLHEAVVEFQAAIECMKLPSALRSAMLELVRLASDVIGRYRVYGVSGLRRQFRSMLGESFLLIKDLPGYEIELQDKKLIFQSVTNLMGVVGKTLKKVGTYKDGVDVIGNVVKMLGWKDE